MLETLYNLIVIFLHRDRAMKHRERGHIALYVLDLLSLLLAVGFIGFALYLFPYLFLHAEYTVPHFVVEVSHWYEKNHNLTGTLMAALTLLPFLLSSLLFFFLSKVATSYLETHEEEPGVPHTDPIELALHDLPSEETPEVVIPVPESRKSTKPVIIVSVLLVLFLLFFIASEYFITAKLFQ